MVRYKFKFMESGMKLYIFRLIGFLFMFVSCAASAGENRLFESQRLDAVSEIENILIKHQLCLEKKECQKKQLLFVSPAKNGLSIKLYSVTSKNALLDISKIAANLFYVSGVPNVSVDVFSVSKMDELSLSFFSKNPLVESISFSRR